MDWIQPTQGTVTRLAHVNKVKGKATHLQASTGPEGSRSSKLPYFKTVGT
jgi:hypothetical protein